MDMNTDSRSLASDRNRIVEYLHSHLIGPAGPEDELLPGKDQAQAYYYMMGALFPKGTGVRDVEESEEEDSSTEDPIALAYQMTPASIGLSFFLIPGEEPEVKVQLSAAVYRFQEKTAEQPSGWKRNSLADRSDPAVFSLSPGTPKQEGVLGGYADLVSRWRRMGEGYLVTVTLINSHDASDGKPEPEEILHQVWMRCENVDGNITSYPSPNRYSWDSEEEDLALIYQNKSTFGIGHGCAAVWQIINGQQEVEYVETSFIPSYEVPPVAANLPEDHELKGSKVFSLQFLADQSVGWADKHSLLEQFVEHYREWVEGQDKMSVPEGLDSAASRVSGRLHEALRRMRKGLAYLSDNPQARECFLLANQVMLMQMVHSSGSFAGELRDADSFNYKSPNYFDECWSHYQWRPFQLAFQLLTIESIANSNSEDRDIADLIWFPTGGGKTEAYLAVSAFELFYRRKIYGEAGGGTAIMLRYTLRLLTAQQFQRAATLICACEMVRRKDESEWGEEPFSLGLWVGGSTTPNAISKTSDSAPGALQKYGEMLEQTRPENPFQLGQCPWCGTRIVPAHQSDPQVYGMEVSNSSFSFYCPTESCAFNEHIPVQVIDEALYEAPPSFLIATIDKFARLAWLDKPAAFFHGGEFKRRPPSIILQDELHLISGPLGTVAGVYEAAIDALIERLRGKPKYIAATATVRRAGDQVEKLYARKCSVFPPSGMTAEDSFFSREETPCEDRPGRLYIGVMGQYHTPVTSLVHTSAALAQSVIDVPLSPKAQDGYWTQVLFHNSLRELGKTMTMSLDDIPERAAVIAKDESHVRKIRPVELSANISSSEIPEILENLKIPRGNSNAIDYLACTNMFSVGVDVKRLGLMLMNGQPKTTSEYIQASSRVGRDEVPGLVVAFYPNSKARDRSQYESFIPYHQALYRAVEPTSVTPYALPSMERALHAALIIVCRYAAGLSGNDGATGFNPEEPEVNEAVETLRKRMVAAASDDPETQGEINSFLDGCVNEWAQEARSAREGGAPLHYETRTRNAQQIQPLIANYQPGNAVKPSIPWATLNSMRNVDSDCKVYVWGEN